ncbi:integral membrane sensor signal transduction histidine kinase [Geobacter metallireducens RCH3]|uniref:histidine kinase n=1 Tax=Geobacter metallireducens (strain ATCC 53774 / DSM 7210 / GS-15) TaxID=269799 RepID=Q39WS7_GEOMG|nr:cache domain-containing protein [Geobacter metallireducens]ABB31297.1 sensor histidine kinase, HAMP domain-containing [Geobacter metallireducens GS-15]EHP86546.1 integral membrane sensor signal transduction histidine kinase [Geobacter metallireducens RCH3]
MGPKRFPIRLKLTFATLIPLFVASVICWVIGISIINSRIVTQAQEKVRTDLNSARAVYQSELDHIRDVVKFTATNPFTSMIISQGDRATLNNLLSPRMASEGLDFLTAVDRSGRVVFRASNHGAFGDSKINDQIVSRALQGEHIAGTEVIPPGELVKEGKELAAKASIQILPTLHARQRDESVERSGMAMVVSVPVRDQAGTVAGALYGGVLLNGNNTLVDRIKKIVFEAVSYQGEDVGTATIFLGDLRIATNVLLSPERRAIGTRLSEEVYNRVLLAREKWVGRAFVVNDWYYSAYEPILNLQGKPVGSLYVGVMERPFLEMKREISLIFGVVLLCGSLIGLAISSFIASRLARPIKELENAARRITAGERDSAITIQTRDEIGDLAGEFAQMTRTLAQREEDIRKLNRDLEQKVLDRTAQLEEKNLLLVKTQEDLVRAAKLADIGMLAAGVAHEINNPLAIIRGNTELLQMAIPEDDPSREEVDTIAQQTGRVERIVGSLLKFARQQKKELGTVEVNRLLDEILKQVGHQIPLAGIDIRRDYAADIPLLEGDGDQLRQVFTNLILNAIQAMKEGGTLTVGTSRDSEAGTCTVAVEDTGAGIPPENLRNIFSPFFTTRNDGTGLGLAVSYGIVRDHGGNIQVESTAGTGSTFRVVLPLKQGGTTDVSIRQGT